MGMKRRQQKAAPTMGLIILYSRLKAASKRGDTDLTITKKWMDANATGGPTVEEVHDVARHWGYAVQQATTGDWHFLALPVVVAEADGPDQ